jgi:SulP family sulfate permease
VIQWEWFGHLAPGAFAIGVLGLLETLAIAKAIGYETRQPLDFNRQCLAIGLANLSGSFFRCMPGAGSLSRTAINHQAGAKTKMSGVFTAAIVALLVCVFAPMTRYVPKAALAGLLLVAAARLIDISRIRYITRASGYDALLLFATTAATFVIGVEYSILLGVLASALLFIPRAARLTVRELVVTDERVVRERIPSDPPARTVAIFDLEGELFFGAASDLDRHMRHILDSARASGIRDVVLRVRRLRHPDAVCLERLEHALRDAQDQGFTVSLAGIRQDLLGGMDRLRWSDWLPRERWFPEQETEYSATLDAVRRAYGAAGQRHQGGAVYYLV